jgi:glycosyltransferase involved in cell wall biosynthesis
MLFLTPGLSSLKRKRPDLFLASFYFYPNSLWRLRKIVRSFRPDVVNVHFPDHQIPFVLALRGLINVRLVVSLHGHDIERLNIDDLVPNENGISGLRYQRPAVDRLRSILVRADAVTACSQYLLEKAIRFEPSIGSKGRVIHNGIDLTRFRNKTAYVSSRSYILGLGRLVRAKGFDLLLDAFAQTGSEKTDLIIAGAGEERAALENQARELGLEGRVHFFGPATAEQAVSLLNGCMLVVIPSRSESFGIVALDALAAGKPILATSVGGLVELLTDVYKEFGDGIRASSATFGRYQDVATVAQGVMLVDPNAQALAEGLSKALHSNPRETCRVEPRMDRYSWDRVGREYEAVMMSGAPV